METGVRVFCQSCGQSYRLDPAKIPEQGKKARCKTCHAVFLVAPPGTDLPLPGTKGPWSLRTPEGEEEQDLDLAEIKNRIRYDNLYPDDRLLAPGAKEWLEAEKVPLLQRYFQLKQRGTPATAAPAAAAAGGAAPATDKIHCTHHSATVAIHACLACNANYCRQCVEIKEIGASQVPVCPKCKEPVSDVVQPRHVVPFWLELDKIFTFPFHKKGWGVFAVFIVFYILSDLVGWVSFLGSFILWMPLAGYLVYLIGQSAKGIQHPPDFPDFGDIFSGLIVPAIQLALVTVVAFLPVVVLLFLQWQMRILPAALFVLLSGVGFLLGLLVYPMVLGILGVFGSLFPALNPALVLRLISRIKKEYAIFLVFWYVLWVAFLAVMFVAKIIPFGFVVADVVICYLYFVTFHMLGRMCHQCEDQLAWS